MTEHEIRKRYVSYGRNCRILGMAPISYRQFKRMNENIGDKLMSLAEILDNLNKRNFCIYCNKETICEMNVCKECYRKDREKISIEERILELEIQLIQYRNHQHVDLMRF